MKWYNIIGIILIIGVIIFVQRKFFPEQVITTTHDTIYMQHIDTVTIVNPVPYEVQLPPDTVKIPADTSILIERYKLLHKELYTKRYYSQDYKVDTIGTANIKGKVFMNRLDSLTFSYNLLPPTIINTTTIANVKNNLYIGGVVGKENVSPMLIFNNKDRCNYIVSYNLVRSEINFGVVVNINKVWKKK